MKRALVTLFILLLFSFSGDSVVRATQQASNEGKPVPIAQLGPKRSGPRWSSMDFSGIGDPLRVVIRDRDAWRDMWKRIHHGVFLELPPLPEIDFSREMMVVVALGERPSSGYGIIVDRAYERDDRLEIVVRSISPKGCAVMTVMTAPVDIVRLPKTDRSVVFRETKVVNECN